MFSMVFRGETRQQISSSVYKNIHKFMICNSSIFTNYKMPFFSLMSISVCLSKSFVHIFWRQRQEKIVLTLVSYEHKEAYEALEIVIGVSCQV